MKAILSEIRFFFRQSFLVAKKDFLSLLLSPLFFVWSGISFILLSYVFPRDLFRFAQSYSMPMFNQNPEQQGANIHFDVFVNHISYINLILLFSVPVLGMRLIAEEKQNRTFDLLMSSPLSSLHILLGKYFALFFLLAFFLFLSFIYPLSTGFFAEIPLGPLLSSYLGLLLLCGLYSAISLFASSLSTSLFLSAFIGMILNIGMWFFSQSSQGTGFWMEFMNYLSLSVHLTHFIKGSVLISSVVFFLSGIILFLFLVFKSIEWTRWRA